MTIPLVYDFIAIPGALLLVYVSQQASHDIACKNDPTWIRWVRRATFYATALAALNAIGHDAFAFPNLNSGYFIFIPSTEPMSQSSMLILVICGLSIAAIDSVVKHLRKSSGRKSGNQIHLRHQKTVSATGVDGHTNPAHQRIIRIIR